MPNWCNNSITLRHADSQMVQRAQEALTRGELLNEFFPCPAELHEHVSPQRDEELAQRFLDQYGASCWYDWQVKNWGTKWDVGGNDSINERVDPNTLQASFDSAWAPPTEAYAKLCALGFEIEAYYHEPGMCFVGKWTGNEEDSWDDYYEYSGESSATVREVIGEELDDFWCISEDMAQWEEENEDQ